MQMQPEDEEDLGAALAVLRSSLGLDQSAVARAAGLPASSISEYERGKIVPSARSVARILSGMGLPLSVVPAAVRFVRSVRSSQGVHRSPLVSAAAWLGTATANLAQSVLELWAPPSTWDSRGALFQQPREEDRLDALALWNRLQRYGPRERRAVVQESPDFRSWALCELLCKESGKAAADNPDRSLDLAELALHIANLVPPQEQGRLRLQGYAWGFVANARRVRSDLPGSEEAFSRSDELWKADSPTAPDLLDESRLLDLKSSLRRDQRRLPEALELLNRALALSQGATAGRILIKKSKTLEELDDPEGAVEALQQAAPLLDGEAEPRLLLCVQFNLLVNLCSLGRHAEASPLAPDVRKLTERLGNDLDLVRLRWLEGRIAAGLGHTDRAVEALREVRAAFASRSITYDAALVSLELAVLALETGRTGEVRHIAREIAPIFRAQGVDREALAALRVFCEAAEREAATLEMARRVLNFLERSRSDPQLHFEEKVQGYRGPGSTHRFC